MEQFPSKKINETKETPEEFFYPLKEFNTFLDRFGSYEKIIAELKSEILSQNYMFHLGLTNDLQWIISEIKQKVNNINQSNGRIPGKSYRERQLKDFIMAITKKHAEKLDKYAQIDLNRLQVYLEKRLKSDKNLGESDTQILSEVYEYIKILTNSKDVK
mgnify:CR=1 FL=1